MSDIIKHLSETDKNLPIEVLKKVSDCLETLEGVYRYMSHDAHCALIDPLEDLLRENGVNLNEQDI